MSIARSLLLTMIQLVLARGFQRQARFGGNSAFTFRFGLKYVSTLKGQGSADEGGVVSTTSSVLEQYQNTNNVRDQVFSALSRDGSVKVTVITARNLLNEMMLSHGLTQTSADALGRTVMCSLMISNGMQPEQTLQITMNGDGPIRGIVVVATGNGEVKGYVGSPMLGDMTLSEAVGLGSVQVVKNHPDWPNPYNGITAIRNGEIDRDLGAYLAESEQRSCALAAGTAMNGILCTAAGGYLVEQLPGADSETLEKVSKNLASLVAKDGGQALPTNLLQKGVSPLDIAEILLDGLDMQPLQQIEPIFKCRCSSERLVRALRLLSPQDVAEIFEKEDMVSARCEFCGKVYTMSEEEVRDEMSKQTGDPAKDADFYGSKD